MFNDRFNDRVSRYRLRALLVLAALVLFGLGAGNLATRALWAASTLHLARTLFDDVTAFGDACGLRSDDMGLYTDYRDPQIPTPCEYNFVNGWHLSTPASADCTPMRSFKLVLSPTGCTDPTWVSPDPHFPQPNLNICGTNQVWGQVTASGLFPPNGSTNNGAPMVVYISTSPTAHYGFELNYQKPLTLKMYPDTLKDVNIVTTDSASALADLYPIVPRNGGWTTGAKFGTFSVPCKITVTKL